MAKPRKTRTSASDPPVAAVRLPWHPPAPAVPTAVLISLAALLVRVLVSVVPYSGQIRSPRCVVLSSLISIHQSSSTIPPRSNLPPFL
jgi:hypothetical protein